MRGGERDAVGQFRSLADDRREAKKENNHVRGQDERGWGREVMRVGMAEEIRTKVNRRGEQSRAAKRRREERCEPIATREEDRRS